MTQIALDGELLTLKSPRINLTMELKDADMSGQTANTDTAEQGTKGKVMAITGLIPFKTPEVLNRLLLLAQQTEDGKRKIYRIGNELAKAMKTRQVKFTGRVQSDEQENLMAWKVSFTLREYLSVPEVKFFSSLTAKAGLSSSSAPIPKVGLPFPPASGAKFRSAS